MGNVNLDLNQITYQSQLRSKPVRENYFDIQNGVNDLQSQINALATASTATLAEITNARDYADVLRDRLRGASLSEGNVLLTGGVVSEQGTPDMTVAVTAGTALVNGVFCSWDAQNSGTVTAPVSNTRLDYIVVNSDNSISIVSGTASATPVFPAVASSQLIIGALVVKSTTTSLNDNVEVFVFKHNKYLDVYIGSAQDVYQSKYTFGNVIIDASITLDCTNTTDIYNLQRKCIVFDLIGNFYTTSNGEISVAASNAIVTNANNGSNASTTNSAPGAGGSAGNSSNLFTSLASSKGGNGSTFSGSVLSGGGGGGGASFASDGGSGGAGTAGAGSITSETNQNNNVAILLFIKANNIYIYANITNNGNDGGNGASGGGAGGNGGGTIIFISDNSIYIETGITIDLTGGDGGDAIANSGGGGGGAGGLFIARSKDYTNNGTISVTAGTYGNGSGTGSNGTAGSNGLVSQEIYDSDSTNLISNILPINIFGINI